jgi:hypothetical protein
MPVKAPRTDRATLSALLTCGKLTSSERTAFQQMYDDIMGGRVIDLSKKQRLWADSLFEKYKLYEERAATRAAARTRIRTEEKHGFETMPRPLKPPGRT